MGTKVDDLIINAKDSVNELLKFDQQAIDNIIKAMTQVIYSNGLCCLIR